MAKQQFKAESKRLMDLMINSIYTHKEIFLREIISNASDALDKLAYRALTDDSVTVKRKDLQIVLTPDKRARTLTVSDNGSGLPSDFKEGFGLKGIREKASSFGGGVFYESQEGEGVEVTVKINLNGEE